MSSPECMLNLTQLKMRTSTHLRGIGWYLKCGPKYVLETEQALFHTAENAKDAVLLQDNDSVMDEATSAKTIAKIHTQDLKKKNLKSFFEKELVKEEARKTKEAHKKLLRVEKGKAKKPKADNVINTNN